MSVWALLFSDFRPPFRKSSLLWAAAAVIFCLQASQAFAAPKVEATVSSRRVRVNEPVIVEAKISWPSTEGPYKLETPEWKLENLKFVNESRAEESFAEGPQTWSRVSIRFEYAPEKVGNASIGFIRMSCSDVRTQATKKIEITRQVDVEVRAAPRSGIWFLVITVILAGLFTAGGFFVAWQSRTSAVKEQEDQDERERGKFDLLIARIENAQGAARDKAVEWGKQLKNFAVSKYALAAGSVMTERETFEALKGSNTIPRQELEAVGRLFERISGVKFSPKEPPPSDMAELKNDILSFIRGKRITG
ncbi:MAG: hypothetical protein WCU74_00170 [Candidatus Omnitrophota bacterium]